MRTVVVLGHSGCGAVAATVDAYLQPNLFQTPTPMIRTIVQRIVLAVREAANGLDEVWGPGARDMPGYRDALIETAVAINAVQTALDLRGEVERYGRRGVDVLYAVHNIRNHQVSMPVDPSAAPDDKSIRLARAPASATELASVAQHSAQLTSAAHSKLA